MIRVALLACLLVGALSGPALAVRPDEVLADPKLEARARAISSELRCMVCQNQSIDDSDASLARDLRVLVRERLSTGDSDAAVKTYLTARYGEFILLKPPLNVATALLWLGPAVLLLSGGAAIAFLRSRPRPAEVRPDLTAEERAALDNVLNQDQSGDRGAG